MLFSATLSQRVLELAYEHMNDPTLVRIEPDKMTVDRVRQVIYYPSNDEKPRLLVGLLKHMDPRRSMVFVNTRRAAEDIEGLLQGNGINAEAISGDVPQRKRLRMLRDFHEGTLAVLIGTDVASRGLHIPDVSHVFNYDLPQDPEDYVHRIGRTARAGAEGDAISFGCEEYVMSLPDIEAYIGRKLPVAAVPLDMLPEITAPRVVTAALQRRRFGERGRRRQRAAARKSAAAAVATAAAAAAPHEAAADSAQPQARPLSASQPPAGGRPADSAHRRRPAKAGVGGDVERQAPQADSAAPTPNRLRRSSPASMAGCCAVRRAPHRRAAPSLSQRQQLDDRSHRGKLRRSRARLRRIGPRDREDLRDAVLARGAQHREAVIHEQACVPDRNPAPPAA